MATAQEQVGLSAMGLDCDLRQISVYRYRVTIESGVDEKESQVQETRKLPGLLREQPLAAGDRCGPLRGCCSSAFGLTEH